MHSVPICSMWLLWRYPQTVNIEIVDIIQDACVLEKWWQELSRYNRTVHAQHLKVALSESTVCEAKSHIKLNQKVDQKSDCAKLSRSPLSTLDSWCSMVQHGAALQLVASQNISKRQWTSKASDPLAGKHPHLNVLDSGCTFHISGSHQRVTSMTTMTTGQKTGGVTPARLTPHISHPEGRWPNGPRLNSLEKNALHYHHHWKMRKSMEFHGISMEIKGIQNTFRNSYKKHQETIRNLWIFSRIGLLPHAWEDPDDHLRPLRSQFPSNKTCQRHGMWTLWNVDIVECGHCGMWTCVKVKENEKNM